MTQQRKENGFTIVELLIVIVVIGILAALVITTYTGIQQKARDTERTTDIKALHGQLEGYYAVNGKYPTFDNMNDSNWVKSNLKGLDTEALKDPKGSTDKFASSVTSNQYAYAVTDADGGACDNSTKECAKYTLTAKLEGSTDPFKRTNLN